MCSSSTLPWTIISKAMPLRIPWQYSPSAFVRWLPIVVLPVALLSAHCDPSVFEKQAEARRLVTSLEAELARAVEASGRAVLADADDTSRAAVDEAHRARAEVMGAIDALGPLLKNLGYGAEQALIDDFKAKFVAYDVLDRSLLELAMGKTNQKAMRLSHGPVGDAADAFARAVLAVVASTSGDDAWHGRALAFRALSDVREVQALEAPHIAEPRDNVMTRLEQRMDERLADAHQALKELESSGAEPGALASAAQALEGIVELHREVVALSRKNTDVRARELSLGQQRTLTSSCEAALRALHDELDKRVAGGRR
jgi:hypothetical protein